MIEANEPCEVIETKLKTPYQYNASCWLCHIQPNKPASHRSNSCPVLKSIFTLYVPLGSSRSCIVKEAATIFISNLSKARSTAKSTRKPKNKSLHKAIKSTQPHPKQPSTKLHLPAPVCMCYDTGTTLKSLCSKQDFLEELLIYDKPTQAALADPDVTSKVLGQGVLDIIINDQFHIWMFANYTKNSDLLMSAVDHLSYKIVKSTARTVLFKSPSLHSTLTSTQTQTLNAALPQDQLQVNQYFGNLMQPINKPQSISKSSSKSNSYLQIIFSLNVQCLMPLAMTSHPTLR